MNITSQVRDVKLDDCYWLVIYNITMNNISPEVDNSCINEVSSPVRNLMNKQIAHQIRYTIAGNFNSEKYDNKLGLISDLIDVSFI